MKILGGNPVVSLDPASARWASFWHCPERESNH